MVIACAMSLGGLLAAPACLPDFGALTTAPVSGDGGPPVDSCKDMVLDGTETDIDCGGTTCPPCAAGRACKVGSDCQTDTCSSKGMCIAPSCSDGIKDQTETDIDCGGVCASVTVDGGVPLRCDMGRGCAVANDCQSFICNSHGTCDPSDSVPAVNIIDDMQSGTGKLPALGGRIGNWFEFDDGTTTGVVTPRGAQIPELLPGGGPNGIKYGQHSVGHGFTNWGAGIGFDFDNPNGGFSTKMPYDGSGFAGIKFWARSDAPGPLLFQLADTDTYMYGGVCMPVSACSSHFSAPIQLTAQWTLYKVLYTDLKQQAYGEQFPSVNPKQLIAVQFMTSKDMNFDYWIGELAFF
jgi:hypothetical protein